MPFRPIASRKVCDHLYAVWSTLANFYVYDAGECLLAFDTGVAPYLARAKMKALGLDPGRVTHVFLTHSDFDHTGGLRAFPNARVYLSRAEEPMVTGKQARLLGVVCNRRRQGYTALSDREHVRAGQADVELVAAPGHTPGSACYLVDGRILVAGDTLQLTLGGRVVPFMPLQNMNHQEDKRTVERLRGEGLFERAAVIATGHTGVLVKR